MFKRNVIENKHLKYLRQNIFEQLEMSEFMEVWLKYKRLKMQYRFLKIAEWLERIKVPVIEIPIFRFISKLIDFIHWKLYDLFMFLINGRLFNLFGVSIFCGRQGSGKTIGIIEELERIRQTFPEAIICTNIHYIHQDLPLVDWRQLLEIRNGIKGVVFVIDEIQNEYDNTKWKDFPERNIISNYTATKTKNKNISI